MADIRIKDLTTLESASLTGDVFVIDGTTGTRKLSAFSPTFGGNATVTGTLTVGGNLLTSGFGFTSGTLTAFASVAGIYNYYSSGVGVIASCSDNVGTRAQTQISGSIVSLNTAAGNALTVSAAGVVAIPATTASTTTSSGALVVGNGTSGGLGVGGAITLGSSLTSTASDGKIVVSGSGNTTGTKELQFVRADGGDSTVLGLAGSAYAGVLTGLGNNDAYLYTSSAYAFRIFVGTSSRFDFTNSQFKINPTTASTSTSSGALVVSGGVGVAGAIVTGGIVRCGGTNGLSLGSDTGNIRIDSAGPAGVEFRGLSAADTVTGFTMREMALIDGTSAPSTRAGYATIYVDSADGDLKVKFGDGTVKTIATDS